MRDSISTLIIDKSKLKRENKNARRRFEEQNKVECVLFDGREDKSFRVQKDDDGITSSSHFKENHYSITDPLNYTHFL